LAFTPYTVKKVVEKSKPTQQEIAAKFSALKKRAAEIKSTNYFCPAVKNAPPPPVVSGILGDKALVNGKWCGQGETSGDAVVKTISAAEVVVEWQGKEMKLAPINAPVAPQAPAAMNPAIPVQADASVPVMTNGEPAEVMKQMQRAQRTALINELRKNQNQFRRNRNNR
jgi:hypothetical protein